MEAKQVLEAMSDYLQTNNIFKDMIKEGVWALVKFLKTFINALEGAIDAMYNTLTLSVNSVMTEHMSSVGVIAIAVLGVAICVLGYKFMFKRDGNKSNSFTGVLLVLVVCMGLPMIFEAGLGLFNSANGDKKMKSTFAEQIIQSNVVDLAESINDKDFGVTGTTFKPKNINNATMANIKYVDITESLNKKSKKHFEGSNVAANSKILDKELYYGKGGEIKDVDFDGNKITQKDGYYRYQANWFAIICSFVIVTVTLVLMSIKVAKILFQMVLDRIVGTILIFSDLEEGKRAKEMLNHVIATFTMLLVSVVSMDIYIGLVSTFATNIQAEGSLTKTLSQILVLLGTSLGLLEGSQVLEKLMGTRVDGGLGRTAAGLYGVGKMAQGIGKLGKGVVGVGKTAAEVGMDIGKDAVNVGKAGMDFGKSMANSMKESAENGSPTSNNNNSNELNSLEGSGEKIGLNSPNNQTNNQTNKPTKNSIDTEQSVGGPNQDGTVSAGFKPVEPMNTETNKGNPIDTGFKDEESPLNTGFSSKDTDNNTGASTNQGDPTNTGFSTNYGDIGELSNSESSGSYNSRNESLGTPVSNESSNINGNTNVDFNDALKNHQAKGGANVKNTQNTGKPKNKPKYPLL